MRHRRRQAQEKRIANASARSEQTVFQTEQPNFNVIEYGNHLGRTSYIDEYITKMQTSDTGK